MRKSFSYYPTCSKQNLSVNRHVEVNILCIRYVYYFTFKRNLCLFISECVGAVLQKFSKCLTVVNSNKIATT